MSVLDVAPRALTASDSILLVEDDHGDAVLVQASLADAGVADEAVTWVRSMAEAKAVLAARPPGCILVDLGLPDAQGYDIVRGMVESAPDVPVIVLTGRQERDGANALSMGAQDYLVKDAITGELLDRSMRYAIERKRAQQAQQQLRIVQLGAAEQARLERGLLPTPALHTAAVEVATYYRPGRNDAVLGGDFFDVVETADGTVRAVIGDVMGHGPDEAALGVHLRVAWRTLLLAGVDDADILPSMVQLLASEDSKHPRYVTVCDVTIAGGQLGIRVAGHPAPIVAQGTAAHYPEDLVVGPPLGVRVPGGGRWPLVEHQLPRGASVVLYTDGLLEAYATSPRSGSLGITELVDAVGALAGSGRPAASWISSLVGDAPIESDDDTAVVVLTNRSAS